MQTYILLTKLSNEELKLMNERSRIGHNWLEYVKEKCPGVKFLSHYALLGKYDFMDIYEAPDPETAAKVSMISLANGALHAESLTAIPYKHFLEISEELFK